MDCSTPGFLVLHSLSPGACSNPCPLSRWCHSIISPSVIPFSCPQSFPASVSFQMNQLFTSGGQSIGASASASVHPMSIKGWFPLGLTGLQSKGLLRVFSSATIQNHQFLVVSFLYDPTLTSVRGNWKNHSFDYKDLCQQSDVCFLIHCLGFL